MLTSISPLGERARGNTWTVTVAWFTLGATGGGALLGALLGSLGSVAAGGGVAASGGVADDTAGNAAGMWRLAVLAVAAAGAAVWDLSGRRFPGRRQVNEDWLPSFRSWIYGIGFGAQLGFAVATVVSTALVPVFMLAALLTSSTADGLMIGAVFGATRGMSVVINRGVRTVDDLRNLHRSLDLAANRARRIAAASSVGLSAVAVSSLVF